MDRIANLLRFASLYVVCTSMCASTASVNAATHCSLALKEAEAGDGALGRGSPRGGAGPAAGGLGSRRRCLAGASDPTRTRCDLGRQECGLAEEAAHSAADEQAADSRLLAALAQRNELLRQRALPIPWDSITKREVYAFWQLDRAVACRKTLQRLLKLAAKGRWDIVRTPVSNWRDTSHLRRMAEAYEVAAAAHLPSLDVNRLLGSHVQYMDRPRDGNYSKTADCTVGNLGALHDALSRHGLSKPTNHMEQPSGHPRRTAGAW